ncbi:hypothetical protein [Flavobacterium sp.]|uniref:hypothetical protein n=1 Tax=Flavobacterium sp. TaxID=239 RepID=UPI002622AE8B|nr:hypothetical protein [Flavobacterium sp.]
MADAIQILIAAGFAPDGQTKQEHVRIPTANSPVFGGSGGELATFGGRQRFAKTGTDIKATVGLRTTALYRSTGGGLSGVQGIASMNTNDQSALRQAIANL